MSSGDGGIKEQMTEAERIAFENAAPLSLQQLRDLLSYLNSKRECDHSFTETRLFAEQNGLEVAQLIPWLQAHGAHCDCEIVYNVYDEFGELLGWHLPEH
jgi:hypothetical protein